MQEFGFDRVCELYYKTKGRCLVPKTPTVVMLMKLFCQKCEVNFRTRPVATCWNFLALHCKLEEEPMMRLSAQRQTVERGRCVNETVLTFLSSKGDLEKLEKLKRKTQKLRSFLPPHGTELS